MKRNNEFTKNTMPLDPPLTSGKGARVQDVYGKEYIDFCSQTLNTNLGQCHEKIQSAVLNQLDRLTSVSSRFSSDVGINLHKKLVSITPKTLTKVNLSSLTGSMANECAIKAARKVTDKEIVISRIDSHLGQSAETMRVSGKHWESSYLGERKTIFLPAPNCYRCPFGQKADSCNTECLDNLDKIFVSAKRNICCVIVEPIMVDAGVLIPPRKYHKRIRDFCNQNQVPLIWDEVQTAFGWLGKMFAMDLYDIEPDIVTLGKGLGAGFPLAATVLNKKYDVLEYGEHETTAGAHPISCAASLAMINHLQTTNELAQVTEKGKELLILLRKLQIKYPFIGDVRGAGLLVGMEIINKKNNEPDYKLTKQICRQLLENGVITRIGKVGYESNVIQLKPPLVISLNDIKEVIDRFDRVLSKLK